LVGIACDGAAALLGVGNGEINNENVIQLRSCEKILFQLWGFFHRSPKMMNCLIEVEKNQNQNFRRLKQQADTRWLSSEHAINAAFDLLIDVHSALEVIAKDPHNVSAIGLLKLISTKNFIFSLYILHEILPILSKLSLYFQKSASQCSEAEKMISISKAQLKEIEEKNIITLLINNDFGKYENICQDKFNENDNQNIKSVVHTYIELLIKEIDFRFPEPQVFSSLSRLLNPQLMPTNILEREKYGIFDLDFLIKRFSNFISRDEIEEIKESFSYFKLQISRNKFKNTVEMENIILNDNTFNDCKIMRKLIIIGRCIPVSTCWPERGFSLMKNIKSISRNRLGNFTLNNLMMIKLNGSKQIPTSDLNEMASIWINEKERRAGKNIENDENNENEIFEDEIVEDNLDENNSEFIL
jgi:hypothetical protein